LPREPAAAGAVDQAVETPELFENLIEIGTQHIGLEDVRVESKRLSRASHPLDQGMGFVRLAIENARHSRRS
jgi:hypothetical protein